MVALFFDGGSAIGWRRPALQPIFLQRTLRCARPNPAGLGLQKFLTFRPHTPDC
jgi:hypothetical protein